MPGVKNSNTIVPNANLPACNANLTGLLLIPIPHDFHSLHGGQCRAKFIRDPDPQAMQDGSYLLEFGIFGNITR